MQLSPRIVVEDLPAEISTYRNACITKCHLSKSVHGYTIHTQRILHPKPPLTLVPKHVLALYERIFQQTPPATFDDVQDISATHLVVPPATLQQHLTLLKRYGLIPSDRRSLKMNAANVRGRQWWRKKRLDKDWYKKQLDQRRNYYRIKRQEAKECQKSEKTPETQKEK